MSVVNINKELYKQQVEDEKKIVLAEFWAPWCVYCRRIGPAYKKIAEEYGDKLVLHGGVNAVLWDDKEAIIEEMRKVIPVLKKNGGYIFSSDHSIPNSVSLENMKAIVEEVKKLGVYE